MHLVYPKSFKRGNICWAKQALVKDALTIAYLGGQSNRTFLSMLKRELRGQRRAGQTCDMVEFGQPQMTSLGACFCLEEVIEAKPDIVLIDLSLNDGYEKIQEECFDYVVRSLLQEKIAVVVMLFDNEFGANAAGHQKYCANHYNLPMIDFGMDREAKFVANQLSEFFDMLVTVIGDESYSISQQKCFEGMFSHFKYESIEAKDIIFSKDVEYAMFVLQYSFARKENMGYLDVFVDHQLLRRLTLHSLLGKTGTAEVLLDSDMNGMRRKHHVEIKWHNEQNEQLMVKVGFGI